MYSERVLDHFRNPRNSGELAAPAITVEVTNPACGDVLRLSVLTDEGRVVQARFRAFGCTAALAAGSALTELLTGAAATDVITAQDIDEALGGLPPASRHAAVLAADAAAAFRKRVAQVK